jgi:hypothetical protein
MIGTWVSSSSTTTREIEQASHIAAVYESSIDVPSLQGRHSRARGNLGDVRMNLDSRCHGNDGSLDINFVTGDFLSVRVAG